MPSETETEKRVRVIENEVTQFLSAHVGTLRREQGDGARDERCSSGRLGEIEERLQLECGRVNILARCRDLDRQPAVVALGEHEAVAGAGGNGDKRRNRRVAGWKGRRPVDVSRTVSCRRDDDDVLIRNPPKFLLKRVGLVIHAPTEIHDTNPRSLPIVKLAHEFESFHGPRCAGTIAFVKQCHREHGNGPIDTSHSFAIVANGPDDTGDLRAMVRKRRRGAIAGDGVVSRVTCLARDLLAIDLYVEIARRHEHIPLQIGVAAPDAAVDNSGDNRAVTVTMSPRFRCMDSVEPPMLVGLLKYLIIR